LEGKKLWEARKRKVKVTIEVPQGVLDFLRDFSNAGLRIGVPELYIAAQVAKIPEQIMSGMSDTLFDQDWLREKYGLKDP
jgi:hypothetical protein